MQYSARGGFDIYSQTGVLCACFDGDAMVQHAVTLDYPYERALAETMGQAIRGARQTPIAVIQQGRLVLRVGGDIQSIGVDACYQADIWDALLPHNQPANALILGLGGGTVAHLMTQRFGPLPITGVE